MLMTFAQMQQTLKERSSKRMVAVPAAHDSHVIEAVTRARKEGLINAILIGEQDEIRALLTQQGEESEDYEILPCSDPAQCVATAAALAREHKADCIMKGHLETGTLLKGLVSGPHSIRSSDTMSMIAFFESPNYHKIFSVTDVGLLIHPTLEQKRSEIENAVAAFHKLGVAVPKVAVLSAVEKETPKMPETLEAAALKNMAFSDCIVEGPISLDLALDPQSAAIKGYASPVAGDADILVAPDIASGNILAKTLTTLGKCRTGGVVLGAAVPVLMTSRSATADDKYLSIVVSALVGG